MALCAVNTINFVITVTLTTPLIKMRSLNNGNLKKTEYVVTGTNVPFLPLK